MPDVDVDAVPIVAELCAFLRAHPDAPATLAALGRRAEQVLRELGYTTEDITALQDEEVVR